MRDVGQNIHMKQRTITLLLILNTMAALAETNAPYALRQGDGIIVIMRGLSRGTCEYQDIVDSSGLIELPFVGEINAEGKTTLELEKDIRETYVTNNISTSLTVNVTLAAHIEPTPDRNDLRTTIRTNRWEPPQHGDFWLPGEYEKELEKRQKR
jgi:protein involved in polysaccharide export with SLBB domain